MGAGEFCHGLGILIMKEWIKAKYINYWSLNTEEQAQKHIRKKDGYLAKLKQAQHIMHEGLCHVAGGY